MGTDFTTHGKHHSLWSEPPGLVRLNLTSVSGYLTFSPPHVYLEYNDYFVPVSVTVGAVENWIDQGSSYLDQIQINVSSTDSCLDQGLRSLPCGQYPAYNDIRVQRIVVNVTDNDVAGISITKWAQRPRILVT